MDDRNSIRITAQDLKLSTLIFGLLAIIVTIPLHFVFERDLFRISFLSITLASAIFWGIVSTIFINGYWDLYYRYFYPSWIRPLAPLSFLLYSSFGFGMWWLTSLQSLPAILTYAFLGGLQGMLEHALAIHGLRILEKVPLLQDLKSGPVLLFSFFEYAFYWSLIGWIALGISKLL
ncbi:MAG: hypothetical protein AMJ88_04295 [Anaerolineae bacterium SM23_ 63]|nr:MAG: hypothetical protein AMJ88_04295 [Anaerolineae bacterium SM23_ 63]HEY45241.1 hypothetical protein [Anaerolineae bacterium]